MKVALTCTGSPCADQDEPRLTAAYLKKYQDCTAIFDQDTYIALPAERRAAIFLKYVLDDAIEIIWSVRGGEGSADIIPFLAAHVHRIRKCRPKILIGFSDFTPILIYFHQQFSWLCIHGPCARQLMQHTVDRCSIEYLFKWLHDPAYAIIIPHLKPLNHAALHSPCITGRIIGGNLSLLQISINDIWEVQREQKILLIEEINEPPYKVDRTLKYLLRLGWFDQVKAVLLAGFEHPAHDTTAVLQQFARQCAAPVFFSDRIGHGQYNHPLPFYAEVVLQCNTLSGRKPS